MFVTLKYVAQSVEIICDIPVKNRYDRLNIAWGEGLGSYTFVDSSCHLFKLAQSALTTLLNTPQTVDFDVKLVAFDSLKINQSRDENAHERK